MFRVYRVDADASVRPCAVAGMFYPADARELSAMVKGFLSTAPIASSPPPSSSQGEKQTKAIIGPHAGYIYSGPVAGSAYRAVESLKGQVNRVVLIGPAHRVPFRGLATHTAAYFDSPLGKIPVDREAVKRLLTLPFVHEFDPAHAPEHGLEVHIPFIQLTLGQVSIIPLLFSETSPEQANAALELLWGGPETLIVVSSDLSHYHGYDEARRMDRATSQAIESLCPEKVGPHDACGCTAVQALLLSAAKHGLAARTLDLRNSGDTAGPKDQVVGYGAWAFA